MERACCCALLSCPRADRILGRTPAASAPASPTARLHATHVPTGCFAACTWLMFSLMSPYQIPFSSSASQARNACCTVCVCLVFLLLLQAFFFHHSLLELVIKAYINSSGSDVCFWYPSIKRRRPWHHSQRRLVSFQFVWCNSSAAFLGLVVLSGNRCSWGRFLWNFLVSSTFFHSPFPSPICHRLCSHWFCGRSVFTY